MRTGSAASGLAFAAAATNGMMAAGLLVGVVGIIGLVCAFVIRHMATHPAPTKAAPAAEATSWEQTSVDEAAGASGISLASEPVLANLMQADVFTLPTGASAVDALNLFATKGISGAPIIDEKGKLAGFVSDGDVMRNFADQAPAFKSAWSFMVELENADFKQTLSEVMEMPVMQGSTMVGIINRSSITSYAVSTFLREA